MLGRIYRVGVTGHRPHIFKDPEYAKEQTGWVVRTLADQYGTNNLVFNLGGCTGADQWVGQTCIEENISYHLFLPFPAEIQSKYWYPDQKKELENQVDKAFSLTTIGSSYDIANYFVRDKAIVDNSDFVVCFWEGMLQGGTYETVRYAVFNSKIVLNALANMSLVTKEHFKRITKDGYCKTKSQG